MDANFSNPMSAAFTKAKNGATFDDARPKSLLKKLLTKVVAPGDCMLPSSKHPCGWGW